MNAQTKESLKSYGGPLLPEQVAILRDMQGWIDFAIANGFSLKSTLGVLAHDVNGLLADVPALRPQVSGYAKYRSESEDLTDMSEDPNPNDDSRA